MHKLSTFVFSLVLCGMLVGCGPTNSSEDPEPDPKYYVVKWLNYNGSVLEIDLVNEGIVPHYDGSTPTRNPSAEYTYTFNGWDKEVVAATEDTSYTATYIEHEIPPRPAGVMTIAEVKELCNQLTDLNQSGIKADMNQEVKIQAYCFAKIDLVKTKSSFGLDESAPGKLLFGDETGYIACASPISSDGTTLYGKVGNNAGKAGSFYEITGYVSMYLNQPEIFVPSGNSHFTYSPTLDINFNPSDFATECDFTLFYNKAKNVHYNCAGHGYGEVVTLKNVSIIDSVDADTYIGTNGENVVKIKRANSVLAKGYCYDVTGMIQTNGYIPSLYLLSSKSSSGTFTNVDPSKAVSKTLPEFIATFKSLPYEDTSSRYDAIIESFKFIFKSNGYISGYDKNGNLYTTVSPNYSSSKTYPTRETAISKGCISVRNDNCWNKTENEIFRFCCFADYYNQEFPLDVYYTPILYENHTINKVKYHEWKVYAVESLVPAVE